MTQWAAVAVDFCGLPCGVGMAAVLTVGLNNFEFSLAAEASSPSCKPV